MANLKKYTNPVEDILKPESKPVTAPIKPKMSKAPKTAAVKDIEYLRDSDTGKVTGVTLPDGRTFTNISERDILNLSEGYKRSSVGKLDTAAKAQEEKTATTIPTMPSKDESRGLINQLGQLTPEQQALANADPSLSGAPNLIEVLKSAGERAAVGAAGGAVTGAIAGSALTPVGALAGAGIGAVGGGLVGGVSAIFSEYKKTGKANINTASQNYDLAIENMIQAITLANKGAGYEANSLAVKNYNTAQAQIDFAESQLKALSKKNPGNRDIIDKLTVIQDYRKNDKPRLDMDMARALQRPTAAYITQGGVQ